jgi:hypothetical protein
MNAGSDAVARIPLDEKARRRASSLLGHRQISPLPSVEHVEQLPVAALPAFIAECSALRAHAAMRVKQTTADRDVDATRDDPAEGEPESRIRAAEAAEIIGCSVRWVRQHGHILPSYRRDLNGRRVTWLPSALRAWMQKTGSC